MKHRITSPQRVLLEQASRARKITIEPRQKLAARALMAEGWIRKVSETEAEITAEGYRTYNVKGLRT